MCSLLSFPPSVEHLPIPIIVAIFGAGGEGWTDRSGHQQNISKLEPGIGDEIVNEVSEVEDDNSKTTRY